MNFQNGPIEGVIVKVVGRFVDERGWLAEFFRDDEVPEGFQPTMGYVSMTKPGIVRGPHEHVDQADLFIFMGPGDFKLSLWDNRPECPTFGNRMELCVGVSNPMSVLVPKGVVHGYRCISHEPGWVLNCPNRLYRGEGKREPVDEIRHELDPQNPFVMDEAARRLH